jgi:hypothetical protein
MLDINDPSTKKVFDASRLIDQLMFYAKTITVVDSKTRLVIYNSCRDTLAQLSKLNSEQFNSNTLADREILLTDIEILRLVTLGDFSITRSYLNGSKCCQVCGSTISRLDISRKSRADNVDIMDDSKWDSSDLDMISRDYDSWITEKDYLLVESDEQVFDFHAIISEYKQLLKIIQEFEKSMNIDLYKDKNVDKFRSSGVDVVCIKCYNYTSNHIVRLQSLSCFGTDLI